MAPNQKRLKNKLAKLIKISHLNKFFDAKKLAKLIKIRSVLKNFENPQKKNCAEVSF